MYIYTLNKYSHIHVHTHTQTHTHKHKYIHTTHQNATAATVPHVFDFRYLYMYTYTQTHIHSHTHTPQQNAIAATGRSWISCKWQELALCEVSSCIHKNSLSHTHIHTTHQNATAAIAPQVLDFRCLWALIHYYYQQSPRRPHAAWVPTPATTDPQCASICVYICVCIYA